jgi:predicted nucleotide-binding protein
MTTVNITGEKALELLDERLQELSRIVKRASFDFDYEAGEERLKRWKSRTVKLISENVHPQEGNKLLKKHLNSATTRRSQENLEDGAKLYRGFLLSLRGELQNHPEDIIAPEIIEAQKKVALQNNSAPDKSEESTEITETISDNSQQIHQQKTFIVFGKDELNSLRLEKLLRGLGNINLKLLNSNVSKDEYLVEKLELEARWDSCALFLFTPEDFTKKTGSKAPLAKPEFIFSLGWFCGKFGFERVSILTKKGAKLPPVLAGLTCIEFEYSVSDAETEIAQKLKELGMI